MENLILWVCETFLPEQNIDIMRNFEDNSYQNEGILNFGNHTFNIKEKYHTELHFTDKKECPTMTRS